jgi:hypothetical protein
MHDYRLDEVEKPERHPDAARRLTDQPRRTDQTTRWGTARRKIDGRH